MLVGGVGLGGIRESAKADRVGSARARQVISKHRAWSLAELRRLLGEAGRDDVDAKSETLAMLRDALMVGCFLDDPDATRRTFVRNARWVAGLP